MQSNTLKQNLVPCSSLAKMQQKKTKTDQGPTESEPSRPSILRLSLVSVPDSIPSRPRSSQAQVSTAWVQRANSLSAKPAWSLKAEIKKERLLGPTQTTLVVLPMCLKGGRERGGFGLPLTRVLVWVLVMLLVMLLLLMPAHDKIYGEGD